MVAETEDTADTPPVTPVGRRTVQWYGQECEVQFSKYCASDRLALLFQPPGEPPHIVSVNLTQEPMTQNEMAVKTWDDDGEGLGIAIAAGILRPPHRFVQSGFVQVPICKLLVRPAPHEIRRGR